MQKVIIKVPWSNEKRQKKAIRMVSENEDVQSFEVDKDNKKITMYGDMDPVTLVKKMRKKFPTTEIVYMKPETPPVVETPPPDRGHNSSHEQSAYDRNHNWVLPVPPYGVDNGYGHQAYGPPHGHHPHNGVPPVPPYGVHNGYGHQAYGPPHGHHPYNGWPPSAPPLNGGYHGYYPHQ
ncbi:hypothetical protein BT93_A2135 [Corymbia citriodora subsp. variegata]|nr:hypothetical protein BT93_A2135 [Corymbia citriodora subsp. variegata]